MIYHAEMNDKKPTILSSALIAQTRVFAIEEVHLRFANGVETRYERLLGNPRGGVLLVALTDSSADSLQFAVCFQLCQVWGLFGVVHGSNSKPFPFHEWLIRLTFCTARSGREAILGPS